METHAIVERCVAYDELGRKRSGIEFLLEYEGEGIWKGEIPMDLEAEPGNRYTVGPLNSTTYVN
jgi:hypothetical protein